MNILILSRNRFLYSTRRLVKAGRDRGHDVAIVNPLSITLRLDAAAGGMSCEGRPIVTDVVVPRFGHSVNEPALTVLGQFESRRVPVLNGRSSLAMARDKAHTLQQLAARGIPVPPTVLTHSAADLSDIVSHLGGLPIVVKTFRGTQGIGVMLLDSMAALRSVLDLMTAMGQDVLLQKFISESAGRDVRVIVIGGRCVAAMRRVSSSDEFRANIHRGAKGEVVELTPTMVRIALDATAAVGLDVAGVDMLESRRGPLVIEVNASPGLEGIEGATGVDIGDAIMSRAEQIATPARGRESVTADDAVGVGAT